MLIKIAGVLIIIISSSYIGFLIAGFYRDRPKQLRNLQAALHMLETEIIYFSTPLPDAMRKISRKCDARVSNVFKTVAEMLDKRQGYTAGECWEMAINSFYQNSSININDKEILISFAKYLGSTDKDNQLKNLKLTRELLHKQEEEAEEVRNRNEKIWRYIGVLTGVMIVLLIF
jgi:stage III sporulation protein AB